MAMPVAESSPRLWHQAAVSPGQSPGVGGAIYPAAATAAAVGGAAPAAVPPTDGGAELYGAYPTTYSPRSAHSAALAQMHSMQQPAFVPLHESSPPPGQPLQQLQQLRAFEQRLAELETRLTEAEQRDEANWRGIGGQVESLRDKLDTQQKTRDAFDDRKAKELQLVENTLQVELNAEKQERREVEALMLRQIDERLAQLREDVSADARRREADIIQRNEEMGRTIDGLGQKITRTQQLGEERVSKVAEMLREEVARLTHILSIEKKMRETTETTMFKMLEEMCVKLQKEIGTERRERERAEEGLLRLLEETCSRVETSMRHQ